MARAPHNPEAEMCALGCMALSEKAAAEVARVLAPHKFHVPGNRTVAEAVWALMAEGQAVDLVTLRDKLVSLGTLAVAGGIDYLKQCLEAVPSARNARHYAQIVHDRWVERTVLARMDAAKAAVQSGDTGWRESAAGILDGLFPGEPVGGDVGDIVAGLDTRPAFAGSGVPTGLMCFDATSKSGGLDRGFYGIMAAASGAGKTYMGCQIASHACDAHGLAVVLVTLELDAERIVRRILTQRCGLFDLDHARREGKEGVWQSAKDAVAMWDLQIEDYSESDDSQMDLDVVVGRLEAIHAKRPRDLYVVDFVQEITVKGQEQEFKAHRKIAKRFKAFAKRTGAAVWLLSQVGEYGDRVGRVAGGEALTKLASQWISLEDRKGEAKGDTKQVLVCRKMREGRGKWEAEVAMDRRYLTFKEVRDAGF